MAEHSSRKPSPPVPAILGTGLATSLSLTWLVGKLTEALQAEPANAVDKRVTRVVRGSKRAPLDPVMGLLSATAEPWAIYPVGGVVAARWLITDRAADAATLGIAVAGSAAISELVKHGVHRERPHFGIGGPGTSGPSFPSQHITMSVATYGTIAYLINRRRKERGKRVRGWQRFVPVALLCMLIGWSRVYVGAHHPTDVLGGWIAGTIWVVTCAAASQSWPGQRD